MRTLIDRHLSFANVVSLLALFIALGGSGYAALRVGSGEIADNSIRGKDVRNRTLTHRDVMRNGLGGTNIKESRLAEVPRARRARLLGSLSTGRLVLACPNGTKRISGGCIERNPRAPAPYGTASVQCELINRRLPLHHELMAIVGDSDVPFNGEELTANVFQSGTGDRTTVDVLTIIDRAGGVGVVPDTFAGARHFRCLAYPSNG